MVKFGENPILFKMNWLNGDYFDTTKSASFVLGNAFHAALETYYGGSDEVIISNESEAIEQGLKRGMEYLEAYNDGFINFTTTLPKKEVMLEKFAFAFNSYIKEMPYDNGDKILMIEQKLQHQVSVVWRGKQLDMPLPLVGRIDKVVERDGKVRIIDYKTTASFTNEEKIDGHKLMQAVAYYLLVYAELGVEPYSMVYEEVKLSKNRDGSPQVRTYELVFEENDQFFDFFFRYYSDILKALMGEMVFVPNVKAMFDNEVAMVAYIHHLDDEEEVARQMKAARVDNITDLLKKKIAKASNVQKLMQQVEKQFTSAKNIDYSTMKTEEKIRMKLMELGILLNYDSKVEGMTVDLYRYAPSIGVRMDTIKKHTADIEQALGRSNTRIMAPIPNSSLVGFEVPRDNRTFPGKAPKADGLKVAVGVDMMGEDQYIDITTAPHVLIAGASGGGKSYMLRSILNSLKGNATFWLADPKGVELHDIKSERYAEEPDEIRSMLEALAEEMDRRYNEMKKKKERHWTGTPIICVIDEFGDFILQNPEGSEAVNYYNWTKPRLMREFLKRNPGYDCSNFEKDTFAAVLTEQDEKTRGKYAELSAEQLLVKLAQKARAAGIHLIIATQSPRAKILTGGIKANFPTVIALRTANKIESEIVLGQHGAEQLLGKGDALLKRSNSKDIARIQGYSL